MHAIANRNSESFQPRRRHKFASPGVICEVLEERALLSGLSASMGAMGLRGSRAAEMSWIGASRQYGMYGVGSSGLGGGKSNPILFLTAPLVASGGNSSAPPSPGVISSSAVQTALQTLQTDLNSDTDGWRSTHTCISRGSPGHDECDA